MTNVTRLTAGAGALALLAGAGTAQAQELKFPIGEGAFDWEGYEAFAEEHDYSGQQVTIAGPWLGSGGEAFETILDYFRQATGADARYTGSDAFEQQIAVDAEAGSPPNLAAFPQPGLLCDLAARGLLEPLGEEAGAWTTENYAAGESWTALGTCPGPDGTEAFYGFPYWVNVKSLVWYVPENFEDAGYEVPESMEELKALSDQVVADGDTPWCIGLGSGAATGWPATDWVEDLMLRLHPAEVYDEWVTNEMPFDDPRVVEAIEEFGAFARNDDYVAGGSAAVAATDFRDSPKGLFSTPPQCYLHRQASFVTAFFPEGTVVGEDVDFFYMPTYESIDVGAPVMGAGTIMGMTKESEAARGLIDFLQTTIAHEVFMAIENEGFLTPLTSVDTSLYENDVQRATGEILLDATTFRFDGSDLMPGAVGAGSFWTNMVDYVGGKDAEAAAGAIQDSWDRVK